MTPIEALREAREELVYTDKAAVQRRAGVFTSAHRKVAFAAWIKAVRQFNESARGMARAA